MVATGTAMVVSRKTTLNVIKQADNCSCEK
jgi:hypothetical protein